jgi:MAF protein
MALLRLASNSPRRRQLLSLTGIPFSVHPVDIDERSLPGEKPVDYVLRLAEEKARAALQDARSSLQDDPVSEIILTADTTVADGDQILGKPTGPADAREMLAGLRGRAHMVYTAIGIASSSSRRILTDLCATRVWMREYTDAEIDAYVASGDPFDKAGAYAIQHAEFHPVERIEGCYACVMGLPVCHVLRALGQFGLQPGDFASDESAAGSISVGKIADACPEYLTLNSPCPAIESILNPGGSDSRSHRSQN